MSTAGGDVELRVPSENCLSTEETSLYSEKTGKRERLLGHITSTLLADGPPKQQYPGRRYLRHSEIRGSTTAAE